MFVRHSSLIGFVSSTVMSGTLSATPSHSTQSPLCAPRSPPRIFCPRPASCEYYFHLISPHFSFRGVKTTGNSKTSDRLSAAQAQLSDNSRPRVAAPLHSSRPPSPRFRDIATRLPQVFILEKASWE